MEQQLEEQVVHVMVSPHLAVEGSLYLPVGAAGIVLFAHGSGSSRHRPRTQFVASVFNHANLATLLIDLLTADEEEVDLRSHELRFDIELLAERLTGAIDWLTGQNETRFLNIGLFGVSTGAGAALVAAAQRPSFVSAVVSRGGRPDLAGASLAIVQAPTLLIVGGKDYPFVEVNRRALGELRTIRNLEIIPGATHLFRPGTLEKAAHLAQNWFLKYLGDTD